MERLILDTSALISLERGRAAPTDVLPDDADVAICAVTAAELLVGVELADDRYRERRSELVEGAIKRVEIIPFDLEIARTSMPGWTSRAGIVTRAAGDVVGRNNQGRRARRRSRVRVPSAAWFGW